MKNWEKLEAGTTVYLRTAGMKSWSVMLCGPMGMVVRHGTYRSLRKAEEVKAAIEAAIPQK